MRTTDGVMLAGFVVILLPAVALLTVTWVYLLPSVFLYLGVMRFIGTEEAQLTQAFGPVYTAYPARVNRMMPRITDRSLKGRTGT
jgi:protein-S-isoprenylcysteine O-methyltransferase Ste14